MTRKTSACYKHVFRLIEKKVMKLQTSEFITDFEQGMRKAISKMYAKATLRGCWYHYSAAVNKKVKQLDLNKLMKINNSANTIKKMVLNLPLLPASQFMIGYRYIKTYTSI